MKSNEKRSSSSCAGSPPVLVQYPCAACKILRRRCSESCLLAPYFPPSASLKFCIAHKVFGAGNIIKRLQEIPEHQRQDAVSSMIYEASARLTDPVYGCAGAISLLQQQNMELQEQLAMAQAEILNLKCQNANLLSSVCMEMCSHQDQSNMDYSSGQHQPWDTTYDQTF